MKLTSQFGRFLRMLGIALVLISPVWAAQHPRGMARQARPQVAARQQAREQRQERQQQRQERQQQRRQQQPEQNRPPRTDNNFNSTRGPEANPNRPPNANPNRDSNRPPNIVRPRDMTPEQRQRFFQNERKFDQLSPQQKQDLRDRARVWNQMTPAQRDHIRNDVIPKWRQLPPDRQRAIQQRFGVLRNMPESARNDHLNDPNFTRGMSEDDKAMLRDLAHMHVGGAPEAPNPNP